MKLQSALDLAAKGFRIFPIAVNSKKPASGLKWKEEATTDPAKVEAWWTENPDYNIGVACGKGLLVVDADISKGRPGLDSLSLLDMLGLPTSHRVDTPSGGAHIYLRTANAHGNRVDTIPDYPGIDIRCEDGYVLGPGSTIDGGPYVLENPDAGIPVSPSWFEDILLAHRPQHTPSSAEPLIDLDRPEALAKAEHWLTHNAPEAIDGAGGDETTYRVAARCRDFGLSEQASLELMLEHWNERQSPPWQPDELAVKVHNAFNYATGGWGAMSAAAEFEAIEIDIGRSPFVEAATAAKAHGPVVAKPYACVDPIFIPKREWLFGRHLIRKFVSVTVAPGSVGKSSLTIAEALSMASGKPLLGHEVSSPLRVWYWNLEDPYDELQRRIEAARQHYGLTPEDIGDRLFVNSGREDALRIAIADKSGTRIVRPVVDGFTAEMTRLRIDVANIDPFVSSHGVPENDNSGMDMVAKEWGRVADRANAAVDLVHHTRKQMGDSEVSVDSARGGKALTDAARDVRVLNRMTKDEAAKAGVENHRLFFRTHSDKPNMAPPVDRSEWYRLESVLLANGDDVGVVTRWEWPDPFSDITQEQIRRVQDAIDGKEYRENVQAADWAGIAIGETLGLDPTVPSEKESIKKLIRGWVDEGWLKVVKRQAADRKTRPIIVVGKTLANEFSGLESA